jgi:two-component system sensor histidine kinase PilS (NtrC family)
MVGRPLLAAPLLSLLLFQFHSIEGTSETRLFYSLVSVRGGITLLYVVAISRTKSRDLFTALHLLLDLLIESVLIGITGQVESPFSILYIGTIAASAFIFFEKGGVLTATVALLLLGTHVFFKEGILLSDTTPILFQTPYRLFLHAIAFYAVGIVSGQFFSSTHAERVGLSRLRVLHEDIIKSIPSGVITTDLDGKVTSFNRAAFEITGIPPDGAIGRIWWEIFPWGEIHARYQALARLGIPQRFEGEVAKTGGASCFLGMTISPLCNDEGKTVGVIGIFQDLTQLKMMEEEMHQKRWLAIVGEMAAGMAHEIRNPLASLSGSIQLLKDEPSLHPENIRLMEIALHETDRLNGIITQFLLYAKPLPPRRRRVSLDLLMGESVALIEKTKKESSSIEVLLEMSDPSLEIFVDPDQLKQVFLNLAINAFAAMPQGGALMLTVKKASSQNGAREDAQEAIEFYFQDTGSGIAKENLPKIFYPFFTTKSEGSGLGLSIVQRIIQQHDGTIGVESDFTGTTFRITIPIWKKS